VSFRFYSSFTLMMKRKLMI